MLSCVPNAICYIFEHTKIKLEEDSKSLQTYILRSNIVRKAFPNLSIGIIFALSDERMGIEYCADDCDSTMHPNVSNSFVNN